MSREIFLLAGEASGDLRGAELIRALKTRDSSLRFCGMGGVQMRAEGMEILADLTGLAVIGIVEVFKHYRVFRRTMDALLKEIAHRKPAAVIGVDYPGFNLRLLRKARQIFPACPGTRATGRHIVRQVQYVSPQLWAWNEDRKWSMARYLDLVLCIFPFEPAVYQGTGLRAVYVGHPLAQNQRSAETSRNPHLIAFFPGSREKEVLAHTPVFLEIEKRLGQDRPTLQFAYAGASEKIAALIRSLSSECRIETATFLQTFAAAGAVCSGTATLEAALAGLPICAVYRVGWPTYWMGRALLRVPYLAMPNLLAGRTVVNELIQSDFTPEKVSTEIQRLLDDRPSREMILKGYEDVRGRLGNAHAAENAANEILALMDA
ncbi:MAG: lipid-A-disaccharide synthase [Verrucomicrobia bacterium]|nr:lipid-A-disaccharide synthase [Verrucomicrobiota bacterium]